MLQKFKFKTTVKVRSYEIDWQGVVHNAVYLLYCEVGRVEYLKHIGADLDLNNINSLNRVVLSRNEIDYHAPATVNMEIDLYTRISEIRNSSFVFEGVLVDKLSNTLLAENKAYHVWLDPESRKPMRVPEEFREKVRKQEKQHLMENLFPRGCLWQECRY